MISASTPARKLDAVLSGDPCDVDVEALGPNDAKQVIEPRRRQPIPPTVNGRTGSSAIAGDLRGSTHRVDKRVRKSVHVANVPIIGSYLQAGKSDNRDCDNRTNCFHGGMEPWSPAEVRRRMTERQLKNVDLARRLGLAPNKISKIFTGERRITVDEMASIQSWLTDDSDDRPAARSIPIIGQVTAGRWRDAVQQPLGALPSPDPSVPPNAVALVVQGDSMNKFVDDGGTVIFDPDDRALYPDKFYVVINDAGETTFKQFAVDPARLVPCSTNPDHRDILIGSGEGFEVVGRVIWRASRM